MTDPNPEPTNPTDPAPNPAPTDPNPDPKGGSKTDPAPEGKTFTQADIDAAVKKAEKAAAKKAADAEAKAKLSEEERAKAEIAELQKQIRDRDARDTVKAEAAKLKVANPDVIYRLVQNDLEFDEKGNLSNLQDVLESAKTDFPELFAEPKPGSIDAGAGGNAPESKTMNDLIRGKARRF